MIWLLIAIPVVVIQFVLFAFYTFVIYKAGRKDERAKGRGE